MATLTVTIAENIIVNGRNHGGTTTFVDATITEV